MPRRSIKKFDFGVGLFYFNIIKGYNNSITIKRKNLKTAIDAFQSYQRTHKTEWLGQWDGKKFVEDDFDQIEKKYAIIT